LISVSKIKRREQDPNCHDNSQRPQRIGHMKKKRRKSKMFPGIIGATQRLDFSFTLDNMNV